LSHEDKELGGIGGGLSLEAIEDKPLKGKVRRGGGGAETNQRPPAGSPLPVMTARYIDEIFENSNWIITKHNKMEPQ
jgi:hypothetical protein